MMLRHWPNHCREMTKVPRHIVCSFGCILGVTAIAKIISAFGNAKLLGYPDPVFGFEFRYFMLTVGILELSVAFICFVPRWTQKAAFVVAWLSTMFLGYRLGMFWMHYQRPCACLGNLTDALHISPDTVNTVMKVVLTYLLVGSYGLLFWRAAKRFRANATEPIAEPS